MCGRFTLTTTNDEMRQRFGIVLTQNLRPSWNIAPTHQSLIIKSDGLENRATSAHFGFVSRQFSKVIINARSETLSTKPSFEPHLDMRRCLVIASGWYEWTADKKPYHVQLADGRVMAMAGLYRPAQRKTEEEFVIITTAADLELAEIHHRTPAVLAQSSWDIWLSGNRSDALAQLSPPPARFFNWYQVSAEVGKVAHNYPELVAPVTQEEVKNAGLPQHDLFS